MTPTNWQMTPRARRLLAEIDAAERRMDEARGLQWDWVVDAYRKQRCDLECDLDCIRAEAIGAFADAAGQPQSEAWFEAWEEADGEAEPTQSAIATARKLKLGDTLLEAA